LRARAQNDGEPEWDEFLLKRFARALRSPLPDGEWWTSDTVPVQSKLITL
jgi:hypothetical protein